MIDHNDDYIERIEKDKKRKEKMKNINFYMNPFDIGHQLEIGVAIEDWNGENRFQNAIRIHTPVDEISSIEILEGLKKVVNELIEIIKSKQ